MFPNQQNQSGGPVYPNGQSPNSQNPGSQGQYGPQAAPASAPMAGPEQSYAPQQPTAPIDEQYKFILNPQKPVRKGLTLPGSSPLKQAAIVGGGAVVLIIVIAVLLSSVFGSHTNFTPVISVAQDQTELARVANIGTASASDSVAQDVAYTVSLSMQSAQQQTVAYLANNHKKVGTKQLALKQSNQTTTDLKNALATSTFDTTFMTDIQQLLSTYANDLDTAYKANPGPKGRQMLVQQYKGAELLISQANQPLAGN